MFSTCKSLIFSLLLAALPVKAGYAQNDTVEERIAYAKKVLEEGKKTNDSVKIAEGYYLLAKRMIDVNDFEEAYRLFHLSMKINERLKNYHNVGRIYMRLAEMEFEHGNFEDTHEFLNEANQIFKEHNLHDAVGKTSFWLEFPQNSNDSYTKSYLDSVLTQFKKQESRAMLGKDSQDLARIRYLIGIVYKNSKDKRAITFLESAVTIVKKASSIRPNVRYRTDLADAYILFDQPARAKEVLVESQNIINDGHPQKPFNVSKHYEIYAKYHAATGDWKNAFICKDSASQYLLRLIESDRTGNISRWRVQMETEKKDLELRLQKQELESKEKLIGQQRLIVGLSALFLIILTVLAWFLYKNYTKQKALSRKNALLMQEQSHRVKNNLQVISSMLSLQVDYLKDPESQKVFSESQTRVDSMVLLHRQLYENNGVELINIRDLLHEVARSVAHTFGVRDFEVEQNMEVEFLKTDTATSIGLIFNELLINSFKYAFPEEKPRAVISSRQDGRHTTIIYRDFGQKDLTEIFRNPVQKSFGLNLVDMILFQINGILHYNYEDGSVFTISFINS